MRSVGDPEPDHSSGGSRLRIALFTNNYLPRLSGVAVAVDFLERALRAAGHETLVVAPDYGEEAGGDAADSHEPDPAPRVLRVRSVPLKRVGAAIPMPLLDPPLAEVAAFGPDLLHAQHPVLLGEAALTAADRLGLPLVYTFHTLYESFLPGLHLDAAPIARLVRAFVLRFVDRCDLVVAPTEPVRRHLVDELGVTVPSATAPTGLDRARFEGVVPARREALGLDGRRPLLVWAGRVTAEKDPALALATLAELVARGHDAGLVVLGDGPAVPGLRETARERGVADRVAFAGLVDQRRLPELLAAGDLFLFTSAADTQGIVGYEAWAAGLPIVAIPSMAGRAIVEPGVNGLLAERDPAAFASAVERLLERPELGAAPFPWDRFGPPALAATWDGIYRRAVALGRRTAAAGRRSRRAARRIPSPVPARLAARRVPLVGGESD